MKYMLEKRKNKEINDKDLQNLFRGYVNQKTVRKSTEYDEIIN